MRQIVVSVAMAAFSLGCHKVKAPASFVNVADHRTANQLIFGFYGVEMNAWRWVAHTFCVGLGPPVAAADRTTLLVLRLYIPDSQIAELGPMTLAANIAGESLEPEIFSKSGTYIYSRELPARILETNIVPVTFTFDRFLPADAGGGRELAAVVSAIGLQSRSARRIE